MCNVLQPMMGTYMLAHISSDSIQAAICLFFFLFHSFADFAAKLWQHLPKEAQEKTLAKLEPGVKIESIDLYK